MSLVKDAQHDEVELLHKMVRKLETPTGRGELLKQFGGQLETAPGVDEPADYNAGGDGSLSCAPYLVGCSHSAHLQVYVIKTPVVGSTSFLARLLRSSRTFAEQK